MAGQNNFFPDPCASFTYLYNRNGNYDNSYPVHVYGSYPENSDRFHWRYFGKEQQCHASRSSSPRSSITPIEEPSNAGSLTELSESNKKKGKNTTPGAKPKNDCLFSYGQKTTNYRKVESHRRHGRKSVRTSTHAWKPARPLRRVV